MNDVIYTLSAAPLPTKAVYLKTAVIILVIVSIIYLSGQLRNPPLIDYRISLAVCVILSVLALYGLTRTPYTKSLKIYEAARKVVIEYLTLTGTDNTLEIPFERLATEIDASFGTTSYGTKWKVYLYLDRKKVYSLSSNESGFSEAQMNEFIEKLKSREGN